MAIQRVDGAMELFVRRILRSVHTSVPGTIVGIDLSVPSVDIQPDVSTDFDDGQGIDSFPVIYDIPLHIPSAGGDTSKLTFPIKVGDKAAVHFSERNPHQNTDTTTHGLYSCYAVAGLSAGEVDPENVVLKNDTSIIKLAPDGTVTVENGTASVVVQPDGNINMNGLQVTPDGNIITATGVNLNDFYADYLSHVHSGVETGGGNTGPKV